MPYYRTTIASELTSDEIVAVLTASTHPTNPWFGGMIRYGVDRGSEPWFGQITPPNFTITPNRRYRSSFEPMIMGHITAAGAGSQVTVQLFLHPAVGVFLLIWFIVALTILNHLPPMFLGMALLVPIIGFVPGAVLAYRQLVRQLQSHPGVLDPPIPVARQELRLPWPLALMLGALFLVLLIFGPQKLLEWQVSSALRDPNHIPSPRGSMILKLRLPADRLPLRDLELYSNGHIWSGTLDEMYFSNDRRATVHASALDPAALEDVLRFQQAWCARDPQVYHPTTTTPAYGVGMWCDNRIEMVHILPEQLPDALKHVVGIAFPEEAPK